MSICALWQEGDVSTIQALRELCMALGEVESDLEPLQAERTQLREQIGTIIARAEKQRADVPGFGRALLTAPGVTGKYDAKAVDALALALEGEGFAPIAHRLRALKEWGMRAGSLRIEREKHAS